VKDIGLMIQEKESTKPGVQKGQETQRLGYFLCWAVVLTFVN
jgi:hypothetical protein